MPTHAELAAKLLDDAAGFFRTLGEQNASLRNQMDANADVFLKVGVLLRQDPNGIINDPPGRESEVPALPEAIAPSRLLAFTDRPQWIEELSGGPGDRPCLGLGPDPWTRCDGGAAAAFRAVFAEYMQKADRPRLDAAEIWHMALPFYADASLYHAVLPGPNGADAFFLDYPVLTQPGSARVQAALPFESAPIYSANARAPLLLDGAEYAYFLFLLHFIRADRGAFRLVTEATIQGLAVRLRSAGFRDVADRLRPPRFLTFDAQGGVRYEAQVLYDGTLFASTFRIEVDGKVAMLDDKQLCEKIPSLAEVPLAEGKT